MPAQKFVDKHCLKILNMEPRNIPPNTSQHSLMTEVDDRDSVDSTDSGFPTDSISAVRDSRSVRGSRSQLITVAVLCFVNLINYMDRVTIAGILDEVQAYYNKSNALMGLLQTAFVMSYMVFAPAFGYLGDRYSRRWIMAFGISMWSVTTFAGSFMTNFNAFLFFRALVGIGEASYSTIAPTIISDLFVKGRRSTMLAIFYFAIPVGSGLGYIVGSETFKITGEWQYALRVTPVLGVIAVLLVIFATVDPIRGQSEGREDVTATTWTEDIKALCKNRSFMLSTVGFTCVTFVTGALAWWGPMFLTLGIKLQNNENSVISKDDLESRVSMKFGIITMITGITGVALGSYLAQRFRARWPNADPLICAYGLLASAPLVFLATVSANHSVSVCYILIFFGQVLLNLNWSIMADMLLYVVTPTRRATAEAFNILFSHAFGDAGSPYLIGVISEALKVVLSPTTVAFAVAANTGDAREVIMSREEIEVAFYSLQYALFITAFVEVIGGLFFLLTALYIVDDRAKAAGEDVEQPRHIYADQTYLTNEQTQNLVT